MLEPTAEWRVADSLNTLALQVNALWPGRSKTLDGTIGDAAHQARVSDHNPDAAGVVRARDITHDPESGADMEVLAEVLRETQDPRIKYVIRNKRIFSSYPTSVYQPWDWRPYGGWNPHTTHLHVSVVADSRADQTHDWNIEMEVPNLHTLKDHAVWHAQGSQPWETVAWADFVRANYTTIPESQTWEARRADLALLRSGILAEVRGMINQALKSLPSGSLTADQVRKIIADAITNG